MSPKARKTSRTPARKAKPRPAAAKASPKPRPPAPAAKPARARRPQADGRAAAAAVKPPAMTAAAKPAVAAAKPSAATVAMPPAVDRAGIEDAVLVRMAQGGDTRAFDELVRRYRDKVYRLSFKILRNEEDAAEALQDAFLSAFRGLKNFKAESTFSTWLYRIATNASLMKYRKRRDNHVSLEQSQSHSDDAEPLEVPDWSSQPIEELLTAETREVMEDGVSRLPEDLQTVFLMRDIQERSNAEVAEELELSVPAVKSRLHRARLMLRDRLNRYFADRMTRKDRPR